MMGKFKRKNFLCNFNIYWVPGKEIPASDVTSRQPQDSTEPDESLAFDAIRIQEDSCDLTDEVMLPQLPVTECQNSKQQQ